MPRFLCLKMSLPEKKQEEVLTPTHSNIGQVADSYSHDAVFGEITEEGPNYRNVGTSNLFLNCTLLTVSR